jgi:hypothetical protein
LFLDNRASAYMHVYVIITDKEPADNTNDFISADWHDIAELQSIIQKGDLPILINLLYDFFYE